MKASYINYQDTQSFSPGLIRFLAQEPELKNLTAYPADLAGFKALLAQKKVIANRKILVQVLQEQYVRLANPAAEAVQQNISLLAQENTFTITTGHQLNLFTGPLYFIYKIATAIKLAQELKNAFADKNFVPVYWMATEDHDFAEINHTYVAGKKISWDKKTSGATGRIKTEDLAEALQAYKGILGASPDALQLAQWVTEAYSEHQNLADATRYLVNKLFEKYGLVILDADHPELKKQFAPIIEADITEQHSFRLISETNEKLKQLNIEAPVNPREINFFYLQDGLRERIVFENGNYKVLNSSISFTEAQLLENIKQHPEEFSPNVVMRPLYQETILPNIAYIGGGAEMLYWLELKSTFNQYQVDYPILVLRNSAALINAENGQKIKKLGIEPKDLFNSVNDLQKNWVTKHSSHTLNLHTQSEQLKAVFEQIKDQSAAIDSTLVASTAAIEARLQKAIHNLEKKLVKAEKRNHQDAMKQIESLNQQIFPNGGLQERLENMGTYFAKYGPEFIDTLIQNFQPLDFKFTILHAEN